MRGPRASPGLPHPVPNDWRGCGGSGRRGKRKGRSLIGIGVGSVGRRGGRAERRMMVVRPEGNQGMNALPHRKTVDIEADEAPDPQVEHPSPAGHLERCLVISFPLSFLLGLVWIEGKWWKGREGIFHKFLLFSCPCCFTAFLLQNSLLSLNQNMNLMIVLLYVLIWFIVLYWRIFVVLFLKFHFIAFQSHGKRNHIWRFSLICSLFLLIMSHYVSGTRFLFLLTGLSFWNYPCQLSSFWISSLRWSAHFFFLIFHAS